ncbi:efflux RND transporter periplasmic adaptor subunit [Hymenobacter defluvii]|uniref:Efflux RND transporter periplasmic adaptor subunit n=1 Tax=Hymenobacter defluvii TaxID=2054411 RepID=A0ABS3T9G1_9BACT|nr:efflux RND transporter periplasmic adaptor subunit [Hymenobacter defluvii]MBO3269963.1 efflux RND transporter periplasmic adaptor subunit [Hymenobacter defluvii]
MVYLLDFLMRTGRHAQRVSTALLLLLLIAGCSTKQSPEHTHATAEEYYTCPMHPEVVQDSPGKCPVCGMFLVKKTTGPAVDADTSALPTPASSAVTPTDVQLVHPTFAAETTTITAPGVISYDPRQFERVSARVGGRIERLYVRYRFQPVKKGQKLYDIYSPELLTEQQNLLFILKNKPVDEALLTSSRRKLELLGLTTGQVRAVEKSGRPQLRISVYSPANGYVTEVGAAAEADGALEQAGPLGIQEGDYVQTGQPVLQLINTTTVWALLQVYATDLAHVQPGQDVEITLNDAPQAAPRQGKVALVEPLITSAEPTATARVYLSNSGQQLKIGQLVTGRIQPATQATGLWVPTAAVLDLGTRQVVFRQQDNQLQPVAVVTGARTGNQVQITRGLTTQDQIAANAQYLTDSESFIEPVL